MELVVAEKPSVARDLARVLGVRPTGKDAFEGTDYVITWCIGHLVELEEPATYDAAWKPWRLDVLPMIPDAFQLRASAHAAGHLRAVRALLRDRRFRGAINACDAGREGELIFRYVYQYAGARLPVRRLWISSMTDEAIRRGLAGLRPAVQLDPLADAARSRSEADWLVGMNATRAVTVRNREGGHTSLYSIGRVQTPTLAMIVGREQAIRAFVPRDYWEVRAELATAEGRTFGAIWKHGTVTRLGSAALAHVVVERDREAMPPAGPRVESVKAKAVREPPPLLFDLTSLQRTANRRFGFTATRTLELAQALYERHKILTYPRTDSRYLSNDLAGELPDMFRALGEVADYAPFVAPLLAGPVGRPRRVFDDSKVHDHHAIIPTGATVRLEALDRDERRLFDLVARRFIGAFHGDAEFAVTEAWIRVGAEPAASATAATTATSAPSATTATTAPSATTATTAASAMTATSSASATTAPASATTAPARGSSPPVPAGEPAILEAVPPPPDRYFARGRVRTAAGWQAVAGIDEASAVRGARDDARDHRDGRGRDGGEGDADTGEAGGLLPPLVEGQVLTGTFASRAKQTTPPPRFTEATLLGAMESAGKAIDDEALRAAMKDSGLGTPATRAAIIETLLKRDFIVRDRQHLLPTETGTSLIEALPVASLASPELTGNWEARLARIARGEDSRAAFMADIARYVADLVDAIRRSTPAPPPANQPPPAWESRGNGKSAARKAGGSKRGGRKHAGSSESRTKEAPRGAASASSGGHGTSSSSSAPRGTSSGSSAPRGTSASSSGGYGSSSGSSAPRGTSAGSSAPRGTSASSSGGYGSSSSSSAPRGASAGLSGGHGTSSSSSAPRGTSAGSAPSSSKIELHHDASIVAALRASSQPGGGTIVHGVGYGHGVVPVPERGHDHAAGHAHGDEHARGEGKARARGEAKVKKKPAELRCPRCGAGALLTGSRGWGCSRWREGCKFVVWFEIAGKKLTTTQLRELVTKGATKKKLAGGEARLVLDVNYDPSVRIQRG